MILLVDDEPALARLYGAAMHRRGYTVTLCTDGAEALERLEETPCHLILSDVEMPNVSGLDLAARLTARGGRRCPILFLTGHDSVASVRDCLASGGDDILSKADDFDEIVHRIDFWLASGFTGLPELARQDALGRLDALAPGVPMLTDLALDRNWLEAAFRATYRSLQATPPGFGSRLVERMYLLSWASAALRSRADRPAHDLRFPDALAALLARLNLPWVRDMSVLLARFDELARDPRFAATGQGALKELAVGA